MLMMMIDNNDSLSTTTKVQGVVWMISVFFPTVLRSRVVESGVVVVFATISFLSLDLAPHLHRILLFLLLL